MFLLSEAESLRCELFLTGGQASSWHFGYTTHISEILEWRVESNNAYKHHL